jgi:hypothetical protein
MNRYLIFDFGGGGLLRDTLTADYEHEIEAVRELETQLHRFPLRYVMADPELVFDTTWRDAYAVFSIPADFRDDCRDLHLNYYDDRDALEEMGCVECGVVFNYYHLPKTED